MCIYIYNYYIIYIYLCVNMFENLPSLWDLLPRPQHSILPVSCRSWSYENCPSWTGQSNHCSGMMNLGSKPVIGFCLRSSIFGNNKSALLVCAKVGDTWRYPKNRPFWTILMQSIMMTPGIWLSESWDSPICSWQLHPSVLRICS